MLFNYLDCESPPTRNSFYETIPANLSMPFLATQTIKYSCKGELKDNSTTFNCTDDGSSLAVWMPKEKLPRCGKQIFITQFSYQILQQFCFIPPPFHIWYLRRIIARTLTLMQGTEVK